MQDFSTLLRDIRDVGESIVATAKDIQLLLETKEDFDKDDRIFKLKHASSLAENILPLLAYLSTLDFKSIDRQKELTDEVRKLEFSSFGLKSILLSLPSRFSKYTIHKKKIYNLLNIINVSANRIITIAFVAKPINDLAENSNMFSKENNNVCYKSKDTCENECYDGICYEDECSKEIEDFARCPEYTETFTESPHVHVENGYHEDKRMHYNKPTVSINKEYIVKEEIISSAGRDFSSEKITENIHKGDLKVNINNNKLSQAISDENYIDNVEQQSEKNGHLVLDDTFVTERTFLYSPIEHESFQNNKSLQVKEEPEDILQSFNHSTGNDNNISKQNENITIKTNLHKELIPEKYLRSKLDGLTQGNDAMSYLLQLIRKHNKSVLSSEPNIFMISSSINISLTNENVKHDGNAITRMDRSGLENSYTFRDSILNTEINSITTSFEFNDQSKTDQTQTLTETHTAISDKNTTTNETIVETPKLLTKTYFDLYNETPYFPFKTVIRKNATHSYYDARVLEDITTQSNETAESSEIPMQSYTVAYTAGETTTTSFETLTENHEVTTEPHYAPYATEETTYTTYESFKGPETTTQSYYGSSYTEETTASSYETITENPETTTQSYYSSYSPETTTHSSYDSYTTEDTTIHSYGTTTDIPESTTQTYYETTTTAYETTTQDLYKVSQDISSVAQDLSTKASEISCMTSDISSKVSDISSMVSDLSSYDNEELSKKVQSVSKLTQEINSKTSEISSLSSTTSSLASDISSASSDMTTADRNHAFRTSPWQKMSNKGQDMITSTQGMITAAQDILVKIDSVVSSTADMVVADTVASLAYEITAKTQRLISETLSIVSAVIDLMNAIDS